MDVSEYIGGRYLKYEDVVAGPREEKITSVRIGDYGLVVEFDSGDQLTLNKTNTTTLSKVYGRESDNWVGRTVELYAGKLLFKGEEKQSVLVKPISPPKPLEGRAPGAKLEPGELADEVPF